MRYGIESNRLAICAVMFVLHAAVPFISLCARTTRHRDSVFSLQERRGHGESSGFFNRIVGTIDSIRDSSRMPPFRYDGDLCLQGFIWP